MACALGKMRAIGKKRHPSKQGISNVPTKQSGSHPIKKAAPGGTALFGAVEAC